MVDIAKCKYEKCPLANNCYRIIEKADLIGQVYADFSDQYDEKTDSCMYQIPIINKIKVA